MSEHDKSYVLEVLKKQKKWISLHHLLSILGAGYSERTVRRWLKEWVDSGIVLKQGQKRGTQYAILNASTEEPNKLIFSVASQKVLKKISIPYAHRLPVTYYPKWLDDYRPNIDKYLSKAQVKQLRTAGDRSNKDKPAGTYAKQIYDRLLIDLSYNSSRLEGNTYSLIETKQLILNGIDAPGKLDEEKTMLLNHKEAIRFLIDKSNQKTIDETMILSLHYLLSDGLVAAKYAGQVRDHGVRIGGSIYIPLENPDLLHKMLKKICTKANQIINPHEKSIFLLAHIAYLQAFVDVNKRTARLSANIPLINHNLVPLSFDGIEQADYTNSMIAIYEKNDIRPLVDLYVFSYLVTSKKYDATVEAITFDPIRVKYRQQRREIIRQIVSNNLHNENIKKFIEKNIPNFVEPDDREQVIKNIHEDLEQLGPQSIIGLGLSKRELEVWLKHAK